MGVWLAYCSPIGLHSATLSRGFESNRVIIVYLPGGGSSWRLNIRKEFQSQVERRVLERIFPECPAAPECSNPPSVDYNSVYPRSNTDTIPIDSEDMSLQC